MLRFQLVDYTDVWGNDEDGWEVNNISREGIIEIDENYTHTELLDELCYFGYLSEYCSIENIEIIDDGEIIELFEKANNYPLGRLELIRE